jgi:hypothetical protein
VRLFEALRRHKVTTASVAGVAALAVGVTTMAFVYQGVTTTDVQLNDGGVWVTKPSALLIGHLNYQAQVLDGGMKTSSTDFDILQNGETVLSVDPATSTLTTVDPVTMTLGTPVTLPASAGVSLGDQTVSIVDPQSGDLWSSPAASVGSFLPDPDKPLYILGAGGSATVDDEGNIHGLSLHDKALVTIPAGTVAPATDPASVALADISDGANLTLTTVGTQGVAFDSTTGTVYLPSGKSVTIDGGAGGVVQQNGPDANAVLVATATGLVSQPLDGGAATVTSAGKPGVPAAPVFLGGCAYAAWGQSAAYVRDCPGTANDVSSTVDGLPATAKLTFRVNRDVVVLNDLSTGSVWLVDQDMKKVDNWDDIVPPPDETQSNDEDQSTQDELEVTLPQRSDQNTPPVAVDDQYGVRPGRTVILPVLENDSDADGDVLTASLDGDSPSIGAVQQILNGRALQIQVKDDASGTASFRYTADDGRGGTAQATVTLTVKAPGTNEAPKETSEGAKKVVPVELGATVTYNLMPDWTDPDGDDMFLRSATASGANQVQFRPDGEITFSALDPDTGPKDVTVVMSDGTADTQGTLHFEVRDQGTLPPITNNDFVVTKAGQQVTVSPLDNDSSPSGAPLRLAKIDDVQGTTLTPDYTTGTFTFLSPTPGTYYVPYLVTNGPKSAQGLVRVTVNPAAGQDGAPVAVKDTALLPQGRSTLVNVLANDSDPNGDILAVQSVQVPESLGIEVEVLDHETLRITDTPGITQPVTFTYTVTNGVKSGTGEVFVTPIPAPDRLHPPVATDDTVTVRAGDVATIPVLANDYSPDGDTIHLSPDLVAPLIDPADGDMFVAQDELRFKAGPTAKTVYATYEVVDSQGQKDAGYVTIRIVAADAGANSPPRPQDVTIRALQGTTVRIPIPLDGIDPDGDSVTLVGQAKAPQKGRITSVGESWLVYEAYPDSTGTDTFTYTVRDRLGAEATATVLVGIVPSGSANQRPYAQKDTVTVRPGRTVAVDVLANDSDPDGDPIAIRDTGLEVPDGVSAKVDGGRVVVTAPATPGDYTIQYTIVDQYGATATGPLLLTVSATATLLPPIARDDIVNPADVIDQTTTDVDVRTNDDDPDGTIDALTVSTADPNATVVDGKLHITLLPQPQIITYTDTDQDGLTASAFVFVPGVEGIHPALKPGTKPIVVNSGETISVPLSDYVLVPNGKTPRITEADKVSVAHGNGAELVADESTLSYTSAQGYYGPDALSFEVTDGTGPDDPAGLKSTLVIPITVVSTTNISPTFLGASLDVAPGEDAVQLNLRTVSRDPDQGDLEKLQYSVEGQPASGISANIDGQTLTVSAAGSAAKGPSTLTIQVTDGQSQPTTGTVTVNVLTSTRPLPSATDDVIPQAAQGQTVSVPVLANDYNPYPDSPLTILEATVETGTGSANVNGSNVDVTPAADFVGTMVVRYRIQDTTGDPDRQAEGRIRLTVQGRPDTIGTPFVTSIQDQTVVLSWTPPINNGAEIQYYTVTSPQGFSQQCASTTCTLSGLTNNVEYTFSVTATNAVGTSDPSAQSAVARPDARPDQPQPPTLVFGDGSLTVSWVPPSTHGSPVETYNLQISPAPERGQVEKTGVAGTSIVWDGLQNGVAYQVQVQAVNRAPDPSDWSAWSATEIPAGKPAAPAAPTTTRVDSVGSQAQMQVNWTAPAANGDAISSYDLTVLQGGSVVRTVPVNGQSTSQTVSLAVSETDYTFTVSAVNKAGEGAASPPSAPRRAFTPPDAPSLNSADVGDNTITVSYSPGSLNGASASEVDYQYNIGGGWQDLPANNVIAASNNSTYSVTLRAVTSADGSTYTSGSSNSIGNLSPYGPPNAPGTSASGGNQSVTLNWTAPARNGRDFTIQISIDGGGWQDVGAGGGSQTVGAGYSETHSISARTVDSTGAVSGTSNASATSADAPKPHVYVSRGGACSSGPSCYYMVITVDNFSGGSVTCEWDDDLGDPTHTTSIPLSGGSGSKQPGWYTDDQPGTNFTLEAQASRMSCGGVGAVARR